MNNVHTTQSHIPVKSNKPLFWRALASLARYAWYMTFNKTHLLYVWIVYLKKSHIDINNQNKNRLQTKLWLANTTKGMFICFILLEIITTSLLLYDWTQYSEPQYGHTHYTCLETSTRNSRLIGHHYHCYYC